MPGKIKYLTTCYLQETDTGFKDRNRMKVKRLEKICHANSNHKTLEVAILISDTTEFKTKILQATSHNEEGQYNRMI